MLFNSYIFIFCFLPVTLLVYFSLIKGHKQRAALGFLASASLVYYGWWKPAYLPLIMGSILFNYGWGILLSRLPTLKKALLCSGIAFNLGLLFYYKYLCFFVSSLNTVFNSGWPCEPIFLPLAISFFTFQQIAYLVDASRGYTREYNFLDYTLFVTFFPQLIAGPIVHLAEMLPQFSGRRGSQLDYRNLSVGLTLFAFGLFKKVVIADNVSQYVGPVFLSAGNGDSLSLFETWGGALSYTFQLYFDFSGYSDMALGLGRMFGIRLPINFNSPYRASNIIDFWHRWHMTLSRFLRDYLYIPLGGSRHGGARRYVNLLLTMLLGGLWHGAGWTFIIWGGLHGIYLCLNHFFHWLKAKAGITAEVGENIWLDLSARGMTFLAVIVGWVFFRAPSTKAALSLIQAMSGYNGVVLPADFAEKMGILTPILIKAGVVFSDSTCLFKNQYLFLAALFIVVWFMPNTNELMSRYSRSLRVSGGSDRYILFRKLQWRMAPLWAAAVVLILTLSLLSLHHMSEFLYFQF